MKHGRKISLKVLDEEQISFLPYKLYGRRYAPLGNGKLHRTSLSKNLLFFLFLHHPIECLQGSRIFSFIQVQIYLNT